ncbi:MAG: ABC transporter substrate-binding protein [Betaproteobacteria bacterium]|nr:ABC transporter substrate-binding protein [Betaproteobacteria bacterium]MBL0291373.1 ABC transporter substrate-binding protein [Betaproteobacteria bacterium]
MPIRTAVLLCLLALSTAVTAQVRVGLMVSATGPTTAIGIPQKNTGDLLPKKIGDATVEYIQYDDGGDTTRAVQNVKKLLQEHRVDAIIGPSTTPNALAMLDFIAEGKVPLLATVGTSAVVEPLDAKKRWVFKTTQNDDLIAAALIKHMVRTGVKTYGFIGFKDPYGENWYRVFAPMAEKAGIRLVATEYYQRTDASVTGQVLKLVLARPEAMLIAGVGGPAVLPQWTLRDQGYKGTIYQTHGVATDDFIRLGKDRVEGTILAAGPMLVIDEIPDANPVKKVATAYIGAYEKQFGQKPATFGANTWDSGLILQRAIPVALRKAKPGSEAFRVALRDAIEQEREIVGCQGVFNMSPTNHNGMDERARVLVTVKDGRFRLLPE